MLLKNYRTFLLIRLSFYRRVYKKLSQIVFEWRSADRASLLAFFILIEVLLQWAWCLMVWLNSRNIEDYIDIELTKILWLCSTIVAIFYCWLIFYLNQLRASKKTLKFWQWLLTLIYSCYISMITLLMGYSSLIAGASLVGGTMLAMLLMDRRIVWYGFMSYISFIVIFALFPYFGINSPSLRKLPIRIEHSTLTTFPSFYKASINVNAIHEQLVQMSPDFDNAGDIRVIGIKNQYNPSAELDSSVVLQRDNILFWRLTYIYFALPKAIIIVFLFRILLSIIEHNKREIQYNADHDALTGIKNRRGILSWIHQALFNSSYRQEERQDFSVILLDLDYFKAVNDTYGHYVGDQVLQHIAELLSKALVRRHVVSRYGGEEFLLALPQTTHTAALLIAEALRKEIEAHMIYLDEVASLQVTASFGVATLPRREVVALQATYRETLVADKIKTLKSAQLTEKLIYSLIDLADAALYKAKHKGRNCVASADQLITTNQIEKPDFELA